VEALELIINFVKGNVSNAVIIGVVFFSMRYNLKNLKTEYDLCLEKYRNSLKDSIKDDIKDILEDIKSVVNRHDVQFLTEETLIKEMQLSLSEIKTDVRELNVRSLQHEESLSMYKNNDTFIKEIRETVNHSLDILKDDNKLVAKEYLYVVSNKVCEMIEYINLQGLTTLSRLDFDAFATNSIKECRTKFEQLFGSDKARVYFRTTLPVHNYKVELFNLLDDARENNIDRRFRTLTIKWLEELCANFIRTMYMK